ncbi:outer membrane beta-barrel protein [uncultured Parabacteroides sp.]|uniref:outer membrane beta-barrel protein n=1 Tax=uncultured Parabacteroides sp. TaxID=512312 RepID=UPI0025F65100|nr:outer membrane beta-barrel protein [uncultured Parabacteroides sp.]
MKKFVLFVMLMMSVVSVSAQRWSLTPEVGMMAVKRGGNFYVNEQKPTWNTRWKIGVGVEFAVKPDRFSLKSGLYYIQRGYSRHSILFGSIYPTTNDQSKPTFNESYSKTNRHFLQVPLMANFSIRLADDVRLNLAAGPYIAYSLGDKGQAEYSEYTPTGGKSFGYGYGYGYGYGSNNYTYVGGSGWAGQGFRSEGWTHDNPLDWGVSFQVGLEVRQWVINVGYDASLGKEYKWDSASLKYHTFSLSVGYKFKLGK